MPPDEVSIKRKKRISFELDPTFDILNSFPELFELSFSGGDDFSDCYDILDALDEM